MCVVGVASIDARLALHFTTTQDSCVEMSNRAPRFRGSRLQVMPVERGPSALNLHASESRKLVHHYLQHGTRVRRMSDTHRLRNIASTTRITVMRLGWSRTLLWAFASVARRFSTHFFVVASHPFDLDTEFIDPNVDGLEGRLLTCDEVVQFFTRTDGFSYSRSFALEALSRDDRCFGIFEGERLLWYCWYARAAAPVFDDVDVVADLPYLYAYNAHTDADHRGRGLHRIGVQLSARFFASEGYRAFTAYMEAHNLAPQIAAQRMGETIVGFVALYRASDRVRWFATRACRNGAFRLQRRRAKSALRWAADEDRRAS